MQTLSEAQAELIKTNDFVYNQAPIALFSIDGIEFVNVISSFEMSREFGALAQSCSIEIPNVNPLDPSDTGYYNWQRDYIYNNKPPNEFLGVLVPNKEFYVKLGYGSDNETDTVRVFTGFIDTVEISLNGKGESILLITGRGKTRNLVDRKIKHYNSTSSETLYYMTYPIESSDVLTTGYELTFSDTNPYLYEIWKDICKRAGFSDSEITNDTSCTLRFDDINSESFLNVKGTWSSLLSQVTSLMYYNDGSRTYSYTSQEDEDGNISLNRDYDFEYKVTDTITLIGTTWQSLQTLQGGSTYRAIEQSLAIDGYTISDGEFEFNYASNEVRRSLSSAIPDGTPVDITFTFCAWVFEPNQSFDVTQWTSHDGIYGTLVATNEEEGLKRNVLIEQLGDGSIVSEDKVLETDLPEYKSNTLLDNWLEASKIEMRRAYFNIKCSIVPIPHLRVKDLFCCLIYGTATAIYEITGFDIAYNAESGLEQQLKGVFYANSDVVAPTQTFIMTADLEYLLDSDYKYMVEPS